MIKKRFDLDDKTFLSYNKKITETLENSDFFKKAKRIAIYVSYKNEADTRTMINKYMDIKSFGVPRINDGQMDFYYINSFDDLEKGYFGVDEPKSYTKLMNKDEIDLMIVPLVAYDHLHHRIGYGKGYYDSYMADLSCPKVGIAYGFQEIDNTFPHEKDVPLDCIINEKGIL